jgi:SAM-dependent methyltransferase
MRIIRIGERLGSRRYSRSRQVGPRILGPVHEPVPGPTHEAGETAGGAPPKAFGGPPAANPADPGFWRPVDDAYQRMLGAERARDPHPWLLLQTIITGVARRALYGALDLRPGWRVLDAGTGFAPVAVELAGAFGCRVVGADADLCQLGRATAAADALRAVEWLRRPDETGGRATVSFAAGLVGVLPFAGGTFDAVIARFLLQHLPDPAGAVSELVRVTRPGGVVCVIDVDDGLCVRFPDPPEPVRLLEEAYQRAQRDRGGDRSIGRKVAGMLDTAGATVDHVLVLPQAAYGSMAPGGPGQRLVHDRLSAFAGELVGRGLLEPAAADEGLRMLASEQMPAATVVDMHLAVIGHRRAARPDYGAGTP